ncbi:class I fructose-bisphosphate aldolase [Candidatus Bandiella euplotis]|nr:class I fructose-bisphosphate aldolase [Candidatus Bandiella woodruffii]
MHLTAQVANILKNYTSETPAVKSNIVRILMSGKLAGTGKMVILPVDQGFEHGPSKSFAVNEAAYDPVYHVKLAIDAELNAYAAPKGMLEAIPDEFRGAIPLILKANSSNSLVPKNNSPNQAITATIQDAIYLGCTAIGFTIYPGSSDSLDMIQEISELISEAKAYGLATVLWSYPRGGDITRDGETALDVIAYATHIAALMGANIIKVKIPSSAVELGATQNIYSESKKDFQDIAKRVEHVMQSAFVGKRLVVFSGGDAKSEEDIYRETIGIHAGGGNGSIIGRNSFQRPYQEALKLLSNIIAIYAQNEYR